MNLDPYQVNRMSLWQFHAAYAGWAAANGAKVEDELTEDEWSAAEAALEAAPDRTR